MVVIVILFGIGIFCAFGIPAITKYYDKQEKIAKEAEKTFQEEHSTELTNLYYEYNNLCSRFIREEENLYPDNIVVDNPDTGAQLKLSKSSSGELVWYTYQPPKQFEIDKKNFKITPNTAGCLKVKEHYPISQIMFFREIGSVQYSTSVSGGGVNLAGAVVGEMVAGATGAVIGSRQGITSSTKTHDDRKVVLKLNDGSEKIFDYKYYDYFIKLIPDKEYSFIMAKSQGI